jgi:hypothetical protein
VTPEIRDAIAAGREGAMLIQWAETDGLFGDAEHDPQAAIEYAKKELCGAGFSWSHSRNAMCCDGWQVWFRSQGQLSPPIAQWSRVDFDD